MTIEVTNETDLGTLMFSVPPTSVAFRQWQETCERRAEENYELVQLEEAYHELLAGKPKGVPRLAVPLLYAVWWQFAAFALGVAFGMATTG